MKRVIAGPSYHMKNSDAVRLKLAAEGIIRRKKTCTKHDLLAEATPKESPIHDLFPWDDRAAAHQYRLELASYYLRSIYIEVEPDRPPVRALVSIISSDGKRGYIEIERAARSPSLREQMIDDAYQDLVAFRRRHARLIEYCKSVDVILGRMRADLKKERKKNKRAA